jgi:uncharacterized protein YfaS (alpha-2-macroglobulin family)
VTNTSDASLDAVVSVSGAPTSPEPASEHGFKIERSFHTLDGADADPTKAKQNDRFVVVLTVTEPQPRFARVALTDYVPAGFEIDNPHLVSSGDTGTLSWIENAGSPVYTEFRDDRFTAAFERRSGDPTTYTVAYVVRAVSPGQYVLPQAVVEDMYQPTASAAPTRGKSRSHQQNEYSHTRDRPSPTKRLLRRVGDDVLPTPLLGWCGSRR